MESGISGLDDLFATGFPKGKTILVSGPPGAGKTVFCMQFLIAGAMLYNEPAVFIAFDDLPRHLRRDMSSFKWDIDQLEKLDPPLLTIVDGFSSRVGLSAKEKYSIRPNIDSLLITVMEVMRDTGATRIVIDSLTTLTSIVKTPVQVRKEILTLSAILGDQGCTTMLTAEVGGISGAGAKFGVEEYSAQGSIALNYFQTDSGEYKRAMLVQKMRGHRHIFGWRELTISEKGIDVFPDRKLQVRF